VGGQLGATRQRDLRGLNRVAGLGAVDVHLDLLRDVGRLDLDLHGVEVLGDQRAGRGRTGDDDRDVDRDLLAATHDQRVDVLDVVLQGVDRGGLRQRQVGRLGGRAGDVQRDDGVLAVVAHDAGEVHGRQRQVLRVLAVAVQHRGDLAGAAGAASRSLTELGTGFDGQAYLGHGDALLAVGPWWNGAFFWSSIAGGPALVSCGCPAASTTTCAHGWPSQAAASITSGAEESLRPRLAETTRPV